MNEQRNNGRGIFYGVIGVATLVVAIVGATFAYFTASAANNSITGNMATVKLALNVEKVSSADNNIGMIPMSNSMIEAAVSNASGKGVCVDNNGNPVCQIYQITLTNDSSAGQFVDGYVALKGGSGEPTDYEEYSNPEGADALTQGMYPIDGLNGTGTPVGTTMRWAQVFVTDTEEVLQGDTDGNGSCDAGEDGCKAVTVNSQYSTVGTQVLGSETETVTFTTLANTGTNQDDAMNLENIRTDNALMTDNASAGVLTPLSISGTSYNVIGTNYIRVSDHQWLKAGGAESYERDDDVTSALVFNHNIAANANAVYYVAVWLSETGTNQTVGAKDPTDGTTAIAPTDDEAFFMGNVTFISAQGSEVSATFANHARVPANG